MLCGVVAFDAPAVHDLLAVLPTVIRVDSARHPLMASLLALLAEELRDPRPGGDAVATRLADVLVIQTVRAWLSDQPGATGGWRPCAIHGSGRRSGRAPRPGARVDAARLAALAAMSRSSFAALFTAVVGMPPMTYVALARMAEPGDAARWVLGVGRRLGPGVRVRGRVQPCLRSGSPADTGRGSVAPRVTPPRHGVLASPARGPHGR